MTNKDIRVMLYLCDKDFKVTKDYMGVRLCDINTAQDLITRHRDCFARLISKNAKGDIFVEEYVNGNRNPIFSENVTSLFND